MKKGIILLLVFCACDAAKNSERKSWHFGCEDIELKNNRIIMPLDIQNKTQAFILDFAPTSSIFKTALSHLDIKTGTEPKAVLPAANNLFSGNSAIFSIGAAKKQEPGIAGVYGYDILSQNKIACHMDFDNMRLCHLSQNDSQALKASGYKEIRSSFSGQSFSFFITIRKKEYEFQFDAAFAGTFKMPYKENIPFLKEANRKMETPFGIDFVYNKSISVNGIYYSSAIIVSKSITHPSAGIGFIKGFNWLIDVPNKKIYIKKNTLSLDTSVNAETNDSMAFKSIP